MLTGDALEFKQDTAESESAMWVTMRIEIAGDGGPDVFLLQKVASGQYLVAQDDYSTPTLIIIDSIDDLGDILALSSCWQRRLIVHQSCCY